jgi:hypothetical protein
LIATNREASPLLLVLGSDVMNELTQGILNQRIKSLPLCFFLTLIRYKDACYTNISWLSIWVFSKPRTFTHIPE